MQTPQEWFDAAVSITPGFEVSGDPYLGVSGDFDGMGISCGALQWNIGSKSLQPLVKNVGKTAVLAAMPQLGQEMWTACTGTVAGGMSIVRSWQTGTSLKPRAKTELKALMGTPGMLAEQKERIGKLADRALEAANGWADKFDGGNASRRLFCWFFDIFTQNGSLEGLTPNRVKSFIEDNKPDRVDDLICDFLTTRTGVSGHVKDAKKNGALWRAPDGEKLPVLCMSYLRAETAIARWRHVVLNRKGAIAMGRGWVNGSLRDFSAQGL
jgi:hypothetical protein